MAISFGMFHGRGCSLGYVKLRCSSPALVSHPLSTQVSLGFPISYGVFQEYYARLPQFADNPNLSIIGTLETSIYFLGSPFFTPLVRRFHVWQRTMVVVGSGICVLSLVAAAFANNASSLIAFQGVLYGIGFLTLYAPLLSMLNEWFVQRRGLAYGVFYAGGGISGSCFPFILEQLLSSFGHRVALVGVAVAQVVMVAPMLFFIKPRLPSASRHAARTMDWRFLRNPQFWILSASNVLQGLAFYIPSLYLPSFAALVGLSPRVGALLLAAHNVASTLGQVAFGHLSDKFSNIFVLLFVTTAVSGVSSLCIWGFAHSFAPLLVFALVFGAFAGAYAVFWTAFSSLLSEDTQTVYTLMAFGKGIGSVATGPITGSLLNRPVTPGYGLGKYEPVVIYLGVMMLASSLGISAWPFSGRTVVRS